MKLIIGLGNPGKKYEKSRHNVGFMVLEALQKSLKFEKFHEETKWQVALSNGTYEGEKVVLVKPLTYMNLSGEAISKIVQFYKVPLKDCLMIYDDLDTPFQSLRIRKTGGPGTHNGMKSIVEKLGSEDFPRIRIGIESRGVLTPSQQETTSFVLSSFSSEEQKVLKKMITKGVEATKSWLEEGIENAMNKYNS